MAAWPAARVAVSAAWAAALRGHQVTVFEREHQPGGQLFLAGLPESRRGFWDLADDLARRAESAGVEIRYDMAATPERLRRLAPDVVLVATGAVPARLPVPGADLPHVHSAWDVLRGRAGHLHRHAPPGER